MDSSGWVWHVIDVKLLLPHILYTVLLLCTTTIIGKGSRRTGAQTNVAAPLLFFGGGGPPLPYFPSGGGEKLHREDLDQKMSFCPEFGDNDVSCAVERGYRRTNHSYFFSSSQRGAPSGEKCTGGSCYFLPLLSTSTRLKVAKVQSFDTTRRQRFKS